MQDQYAKSEMSSKPKLITNCHESIKEWQESQENKHNSNTALNMLDESNSQDYPAKSIYGNQNGLLLSSNQNSPNKANCHKTKKSSIVSETRKPSVRNSISKTKSIRHSKKNSRASSKIKLQRGLQEIDNFSKLIDLEDFENNSSCNIQSNLLTNV